MLYCVRSCLSRERLDHRGDIATIIVELMIAAGQATSL
jgi:hypothetical protein